MHLLFTVCNVRGLAAFITFLDKRQHSLQREDDNLLTAVGNIFGWK
jgi:hypothetical protein